MLVSCAVSTLGVGDLRRPREELYVGPSVYRSKEIGSYARRCLVGNDGDIGAIQSCTERNLCAPARFRADAHRRSRRLRGPHHIHYAENGTGAVRDFDSTDPEGSAIEWNVRGVDAADFEISSAGVLTFMESPDYENPTDRGLNLNPADD